MHAVDGRRLAKPGGIIVEREKTQVTQLLNKGINLVKKRGTFSIVKVGQILLLLIFFSFPSPQGLEGDASEGQESSAQESNTNPHGANPPDVKSRISTTADNPPQFFPRLFGPTDPSWTVQLGHVNSQSHFLNPVSYTHLTLPTTPYV